MENFDDLTITLTYGEATVLKNFVLNEINEFKASFSSDELGNARYFGYLNMLYRINSKLPKTAQVFEENG